MISCAKEEAPAAAPEKPVEKVEVATQAFADGIYFAQEDAFAASGWKSMVTVTVEGGKITSAAWDGANISAGEDKKSVSEKGRYNMVAYGGAQAEWHEQAAKAEASLLKTQDPTAITYTDEDGHTDPCSLM